MDFRICHCEWNEAISR